MKLSTPKSNLIFVNVNPYFALRNLFEKLVWPYNTNSCYFFETHPYSLICTARSSIFVIACNIYSQYSL